MRLVLPTSFGRLLGQPLGQLSRDAGPGFGIPHLLTMLLLIVTLPVFLVGAVVALPLGAVVLSYELARSAWTAAHWR